MPDPSQALADAMPAKDLAELDQVKMDELDAAALQEKMGELLGEREKVSRGRPSIEDLEKLLEDEEWDPIEILPNGEIRAIGGSDKAERKLKKPLTMREDLGGEYSEAA